MDKNKEKEIYVEMLGDLVKQRRAITDEILLVRNHISDLDKEIERHHEYMSAAEYLTIRNSIRHELEVEMRQQIREEVANENKVNSNTEEPVIAKEVVSEARFKESKKSIKKDISPETIANVLISFLKEMGRPASVKEIKTYIEENRNHSWKPKSFNTLLWKTKNIDPRIENPSRGFYQYNARGGDNL